MFLSPVIRRPALSSLSLSGLRTADRSFERWLDQSFGAATTRNYRFEQDEKSWTLSLDLPGIAREQLSIGIEGNVVRLETLPEATRPFQAAYELPQDIDAQASEAKLENGVLTVRLGKKQAVSNVTPLAIH